MPSKETPGSVSRNVTPPIHVSCAPHLRCPISSSLSRLWAGRWGRARGAVRCVCLRVTATRDHWLVLLTTKALSKKKIKMARKIWIWEFAVTTTEQQHMCTCTCACACLESREQVCRLTWRTRRRTRRAGGGEAEGGAPRQGNPPRPAPLSKGRRAGSRRRKETG